MREEDQLRARWRTLHRNDIFEFRYTWVQLSSRVQRTRDADSRRIQNYTEECSNNVPIDVVESFVALSQEREDTTVRHRHLWYMNYRIAEVMHRGSVSEGKKSVLLLNFVVIICGV